MAGGPSGTVQLGPIRCCQLETKTAEGVTSNPSAAPGLHQRAVPRGLELLRSRDLGQCPATFLRPPLHLEHPSSCPSLNASPLDVVAYKQPLTANAILRFSLCKLSACHAHQFTRVLHRVPCARPPGSTILPTPILPRHSTPLTVACDNTAHPNPSDGNAFHHRAPL